MRTKTIIPSRLLIPLVLGGIVGLLLGVLGSSYFKSLLPQTAIQPKVSLQFIDKQVGKVATSDSVYQARQEGQDIILVDVREKEEWDAEHIPGAVWIPHSQLKENDQEAWSQLEMLAKTHKYVLTYCGAGHRSGFVASEAQEKQLANVYNLDGFSFWKQRYPITKGQVTPDKEPKMVHLDEAYYYFQNFDDVVFVDVREKESIERTGGKIIRGAKWVPLSEMAKHLDEFDIQKDHVFICEGTFEGGECSASPAAAKMLIERKEAKAGKMKYLLEGHGAWEAKGYPVEPLPAK